LEKVAEFVEVRCPKCGGKARRETDTMDTFVDSSWYFFRYLSPRNADEPFTRATADYWFPIDLYVGGVEHAILHLVYARFWTKVMRDLGLVGLNEPVTRLFPQGMVHKDGEVMSKSKGNTVAPDEVVRRYGADTLRLYILFVGPPEKPLEWKEEGIEGAHRFLQRVWRLFERHSGSLVEEKAGPVPSQLPAPAQQLRRKVHQTIAKVTSDIDQLTHLNTAVAALMELVNDVYRLEPEVAEGPGRAALREALETLALLLNPFTPHLCEQLWLDLGHPDGLVDHPWPQSDPEIAREELVELAVQVNGKVRGHITVTQGESEEEVRRQALEHTKVSQQVAGKQIVKLVVVPGRLVSIVVR
jgi:leucyl-tRNA synthetase